MQHVLKREFVDSFKSVRAVLIVLFLVATAYFSANFFDNHQKLITSLLENNTGIEVSAVYAMAVSMVVMVFGCLFVFSISHDIINNETETKTIRLLISKISRTQMMTGKFLGNYLFWFVAITVTYLVIFVISGTWSLTFYIQTLALLLYFVSLAFMLSTLIAKTKLSMFLGILIGIMLPIVNAISIFNDQWYFLPTRYLLPFYYTNQTLWFMLVPVAISLVFVGIAMAIMRRRDF